MPDAPLAWIDAVEADRGVDVVVVIIGLETTLPDSSWLKATLILSPIFASDEPNLPEGPTNTITDSKPVMVTVAETKNQPSCKTFTAKEFSTIEPTTDELLISPVVKLR